MQHETRILIVDDDVRYCRSVEALLGINGYQIVTANSGQQAVEVFDRERPDLALLDVCMPDTNGFKLLKFFKEKIPSMPIIMLTADASVDAAVDALRQGAYDYLHKPFEHTKLIKTIHNALEQQRLRAQNTTITQELVKQQERYRYLVQSSPDIIYTLDESGCFNFISDSVGYLLGYQPDEVIGHHYTSLVARQDWDKAQWTFNERRTGKRATAGVELRLVVKRPQHPDSARNGHFRPIELKSTGLYAPGVRDDSGGFIGSYGVGRDISDRKKLENQLQHAQRQEAMGRLAGGIAHDFNNLLMGIQGRASLLALELGSSHPQREHIEAIEEYVRSATDLTKQLLGFARGGKYEVKPVDINGLLQSSAAMFGRTRKDIRIHIRPAADTLVVDADKRQIEQVLLNIFINAWQAMPNGGDLYLETALASFGEGSVNPDLKQGRYAKVSVTDTGIGMDEATRQRVFDPFFTTKDKGRGTGLGLASAYGIIKNHGGMISVYSEMGHGSTFNLYLPLSRKELQSEVVDSGQLVKGTESVLLVDDEKMIVDVGQAMLEKLGYRVASVNSGEAALAAINKESVSFDLVILDLIMPGMDGGKVFDHIRRIRPAIPVMLSSGYAMNGMAEDIMQRGCNGFIQKPFNIYELSQSVRKVLDGAKP